MNTTQTEVTNDEALKTSELFFKARDGRWLPINTPTKQIPTQPSNQERLSALLLQAAVVESQIAALRKTSLVSNLISY